jgi:hypothetical protein
MKIYALGRGGFADMYRAKIGQRYEFNRYGPQQFMRAGKPSDARKLYHNQWQPGDCLFEVRDPEPGRPGWGGTSGTERADAFVIVREVPISQAFGRSAARAESFIRAVDWGTFDQAEQFLSAWVAMPDGWDHCDCAEGTECSHEPVPGSRGSFADSADASEDDPEDESILLFIQYAGPIVKQYAAAIWWWHAGRLGWDVASERPGAIYSRTAVRLPGMGTESEWIKTAVRAYEAGIGCALRWHQLSEADRSAWANLTAGYFDPADRGVPSVRGDAKSAEPPVHCAN